MFRSLQKLVVGECTVYQINSYDMTLHVWRILSKFGCNNHEILKHTLCDILWDPHLKACHDMAEI